MNDLILITGANRGLGLESARQLARLGNSIILTSRNASEGRKAASELKDNSNSVYFYPLDLNDPSSRLQVFEYVRKEFGRLDVLINNAAIHYDQLNKAVDPNFQVIEEALQTNLINTWKLTVQLLPLISESHHGRIVNVSSGSGALTNMVGGTPGYSISKAGLNVLTIKLASELADGRILVNAVCPGWVRTDMGGPQAPLSLSEGARGIVWAAKLPKDGPSGGFFRNGQRIDW